MTWQYAVLYAELFVTSMPFVVGLGFGLSLGVGAGWWLGRRAMR